MLRTIGAAAALALIVGCGSDEPPAIVADQFVIPLLKQSHDGELSVSLTGATPSPPAKGNNEWSLEITDADGLPVENLDFDVVLFMPEHGHGSSATTVAAGANPGDYNVTRINFIMGGIWEVQVISRGESPERDVSFYVDVAD